MKYNIDNIYQEVYKQMEYYYNDSYSSVHVVSNVIDDFNDWVSSNYEMVKLALQAIYDFSEEFNVYIPMYTYSQMKHYNVVK